MEAEYKEKKVLTKSVLRILLATSLVIGLAGAKSAAAVDGMAVELGSGSGSLGPGTSAESARVALVWEWDKRWFTGGSWWLGGQWEGTVGYIRNRARDDSLSNAGFSAALRLWPYHPWWAHARQFLEAGTGVNFFSETHLGDKNISTSLQFGSFFGFGVRFGKGERYEIGYRQMHFSNADIKTPNPGMDFDELRLAYHF
jgi:lipid A 3-O-deacylase